jgi:hypothetical protein
MPDYRIYQLDASGGITGSHEAHCVDDGHAYESAEAYLDRSSEGEIWEGTRRVGRITVPAKGGDSMRPLPYSGATDEHPPRVGHGAFGP